MVQLLRGRPARLAVVLIAVVLAVWANGKMRPTAARRSPPALPSASPTTGPLPSPTQTPLSGFDTVILGGRVMDPETNLDKVLNVGIVGSTIAAISDRPMTGKSTIDARGKVVSPGFIDNLSYEPNRYGVWYKVADGVTTTLGMHGLDGSATTFFRNTKSLPLNYGGAFDNPWWRTKIGVGAYQKPTAAQIAELARIADREIAAGWIGVDVEPEYQPGTSTDEIVAVARVAARHKMTVFFHVRYSDDTPPGTNAEALQEVIDVARKAKASVHVEHINSTGGTFSMRQSLAMLESARKDGVDVTACVYPYNFWSTFLGSARFNPGWQERFHITYSDLEMPGTGERLTASSFDRYRKQNRVVVAHAIPEEEVRLALQSPFVMLGSDSILVADEGRHPRAAGTFARVLGKYVREERVLTLMQALAKMTIMPAERVEAGAPAMRKKGRLQVGMDADITIFDPATVIDRATVRNPAQYSEGIEWVLVMGRVVKDQAGLKKNVLPGIPIVSAAAAGS